MMKTGIILLAAGSSSRLGRAKQLIEIQGETLINKAIKEAEKSKADGLVVVLGANAALIQTGFGEIELEHCKTPYSPRTHFGLGTLMFYP
ncbi:MAG: nucleotidyltransferase family protein, partial [Cyclobacteriaceae bacterium]|nr:nucleotidyltransferase family protein [Cyclobacteriaceae bacterium]